MRVSVCMLGFACVGGVAVKRPMTSGHGQRADGQEEKGMSGRTSWRVGGFYAYTYTFFICWHFAIYFIFVLLETAAWQRQQQQQHQLCPVTSFSSLAVVVGAAQRPFSPEMSLSLCPSGCLFVCLCVAALSTPPATDSDSCCSFPVCTLRNLLAALLLF